MRVRTDDDPGGGGGYIICMWDLGGADDDGGGDGCDVAADLDSKIAALSKHAEHASGRIQGYKAACIYGYG